MTILNESEHLNQFKTIIKINSDLNNATVNLQEAVGVTLPTALPMQLLEYSDGVFFFQHATESFVRVLIKGACRATTTENLTATYANGTLGVGATLTNSGTLAAFVIDGITINLNERVLVKDQTYTFQNGIFTLTTVGTASVAWVLTRVIDYDCPYLINPGDSVVIVSGTVNASSAFMQTEIMAAIGTSPILFTSLSNASVLTVTGTINQITVTGTPTNPIIGIANNPIIPGTGGMTMPGGSAAQRPVGAPAGTIRRWDLT